MTRLRFMESLAAACTAVLAFLGLRGAGRVLERPDGFGTSVKAWRIALSADQVPAEGEALKIALAGRTFIVRLVNDRPQAWDATCTHAGCAVDWAAEESRFYCACHRSFFAEDGTPQTGPTQRGLVSVEARWGRGDVVELLV